MEKSKEKETEHPSISKFQPHVSYNAKVRKDQMDDQFRKFLNFLNNYI